ncbi:hypothetical protein [Kitasatospora sp. NPDC059571]|uniref:hypothetical protein n=1 Tax=Kitasatospora sp. NPDC059571 TaxID=3346871 RepID=UPI0036B64EA3
MYGQGQQYPQGQPQQPPYGQPPQYGGQPQPPAYGYPQAQPAPPYGAPQPPYGAPQQPAYPQAPVPQPPYGGGPGGYPPPQRPKGNTGLVIGLVIGAVVLVGGGLAVWGLSSGSTKGGGSSTTAGTTGGSTGTTGGGGTAAAAYKIDTPLTLLDGYAQKTATSAPATPGPSADQKSVCEHDPIGVITSYSKSATDIIQILGCYGTIASPSAAMATFEMLSTKPTTIGSTTVQGHWTTPLADYPAGSAGGSGAKLKCGVFSNSSGGKTISGSTVCFWTDHSTAAEVVFNNLSLGGKLTPSQAAEKARSIRDAMIVKK